MTSPAQVFESTDISSLLQRVAALKKDGWRIVAISCSRLPGSFEVLYSFDRDYQLFTLRLELPSDNPKLPSVSSIFWSAILYENELHDLFGIQVDGIVVDFKGNFYKTAVKFPFVSTKAPQPAAAAAAAPAQPPAKAGSPVATSTTPKS